MRQLAGAAFSSTSNETIVSFHSVAAATAAARRSTVLDRLLHDDTDDVPLKASQRCFVFNQSILTLYDLRNSCTHSRRRRWRRHIHLRIVALFSLSACVDSLACVFARESIMLFVRARSRSFVIIGHWLIFYPLLSRKRRNKRREALSPFSCRRRCILLAVFKPVYEVGN